MSFLSPSTLSLIERALALWEDHCGKKLEFFAENMRLAELKRDSNEAVLLALEPNFADVFEAAHPDAELFYGDFRRMNPADFPEFDIIVSGLPCDHFSVYRVKPPDTREVNGLPADRRWECTRTQWGRFRQIYSFAGDLENGG